MIKDKYIMVNIMYGAFQKYYSALLNLRRFDKENDFFNNISCLDNFFSEFRSITFVLQKSIAHTKYKSLYEKYRQTYLSDCKWFVEKRNQTIKEEPFPLVKQINISIYFANIGFSVDSQKFYVENDVPLTTLIHKFEDLFSQLDPVQVFFSAKFSFYEKNNNENIFLKIIDGINTMHSFLLGMYKETDEKCDLCDELILKIEEIKRFFIIDDILLINDYVYYPQKKKFDKSQTITMFPGGGPLLRSPLSGFDICKIQNSDNDYFKKFVFMHAIQQNTELMPTIMTVYSDKTFTLDSFTSDIKTIFYRKINETAKRIIEEDIIEVYFMTVYVSFELEHINIPSVERSPYIKKEYLTFMKVDYNLNEEEYVFDGNLLKDMGYIFNNILYGKKAELGFGKNNMQPIIEAFITKRQD